MDTIVTVIKRHGLWRQVRQGIDGYDENLTLFTYRRRQHKKGD
jgi:hypothetical protein